MEAINYLFRNTAFDNIRSLLNHFCPEFARASWLGLQEAGLLNGGTIAVRSRKYSFCEVIVTARELFYTHHGEEFATH